MPVARRPLVFNNLDEVVRDAETLLTRGYEKAGNWDLGQVCEHLGRSMQASLDGFGVRAPWFLRVFLAPFFKRRIFKTRVMPAGIKGPPELMPGPQVDETAAHKNFDAQLARVRDHPDGFQKHPFFGKLTAEEWRQFHLIHSSLHLGFLFPGSQFFQCSFSSFLRKVQTHEEQDLFLLVQEWQGLLSFVNQRTKGIFSRLRPSFYRRQISLGKLEPSQEDAYDA